MIAARSIKEASKLLGLSWDQVHHIQARAVERGLALREVKEIKHVGIDETSFLKGHFFHSLSRDRDLNATIRWINQLVEMGADIGLRSGAGYSVDMEPSWAMRPQILSNHGIPREKHAAYGVYYGELEAYLKSAEFASLVRQSRLNEPRTSPFQDVNF